MSQRQADELESLRARSYPHYLALWLVPPRDRELALAMFDLERELRAIPEKVSQPVLGLMRVTWWRDALLDLAAGTSRAHPAIERLAGLHLAEPQLAGLANWAESFDEPFVPDEEKEGRLQQRKKLSEGLLGAAAAGFLQRADPAKSRIYLIFQALIAQYKGK